MEDAPRDLRILVTGVTGGLGEVLVERLAKRRAVALLLTREPARA